MSKIHKKLFIKYLNILIFRCIIKRKNCKICLVCRKPFSYIFSYY